MSKLIPMDEVATILGMTADEVADLRSKNEIFGYRDGSTWKFKMSEIERVADELGLTLNVPSAENPMDAVKGKIDDAISELGLSLEDSSEELVLQEPDSVEYMEDSSVELFSSDFADSASGLLSASSIKVDDLRLLDEDDSDSLKLDDSGLLPQAPGTSKGSDKGSKTGLKLDDEIDLSSSSIFDGDDALSFGSSSLKMAGGKGSGTGKDAGDLLDDEAVSESGSGTGKDGGDGLLLADDDLFEDELSLEDSVSFEDSADLSSDFEHSDDLALDDSDSSAELMLENDKSGVVLTPSESGVMSMSSDEPLELGGSEIDALELDDDDVIVVDEMSDADDPTILKDDDFNLTPLEEAAADGGASTSQVIALEDSAIYADEAEPTVMGEEAFEADAGFVEDAGGLDDDIYGEPAVAGAGAVAGTPEVPYTKWQVISLGLVTSLLGAGGLIAYDVARNMWMPENQTIGRGVLKFFLGITGMG